MKKLLIVLVMMGLISTTSFAAEGVVVNATKPEAKTEKIEPIKATKPVIKQHIKTKKHKKTLKGSNVIEQKKAEEKK